MECLRHFLTLDRVYKPLLDPGYLNCKKEIISVVAIRPGTAPGRRPTASVVGPRSPSGWKSRCVCVRGKE